MPLGSEQSLWQSRLVSLVKDEDVLLADAQILGHKLKRPGFAALRDR